MIKNLAKFSGLAAFAAIAATASAEVKLNDYLSIDGYATAAARVTEGTTTDSGFVNGSNQVQIENNCRTDNSGKLALNGKYQDFTAKVSGLLQNGDNYQFPGDQFGTSHNFGLLDYYVTYKNKSLYITGGKFFSFLGYESFDSPKNAFISHSLVGLYSNYGTGVKIEYSTEKYSTGFSVRDSNDGAPKWLLGDGKFYQGDGDFSNNLGYEAYFLYKGIEKFQIFTGIGYEETNINLGTLTNYDIWVSYDITDKLKIALEGAYMRSPTVGFDGTSFEYFGSVRNVYSGNLIATYSITSALSISTRVGSSYSGKEEVENPLNSRSKTRYMDYGMASSYAFTRNFSLKAEVVKNTYDHESHFPGGLIINQDSTKFTYALQAVIQF